MNFFYLNQLKYVMCNINHKFGTVLESKVLLPAYKRYVGFHSLYLLIYLNFSKDSKEKLFLQP